MAVSSTITLARGSTAGSTVSCTGQPKRVEAQQSALQCGQNTAPSARMKVATALATAVRRPGAFARPMRAEAITGMRISQISMVVKSG